MRNDVGLSHDIQNQNSIHDMGTTISPPAKKCETIQLVEKIMTTVILDHKAMPIVDFPEHGDTITAEYYFDTRDVTAGLHHKRPKLLLEGIIILYDNAMPHIANWTCNWWYGPPSCSNPMTSDFHCFGPGWHMICNR
jgi:hypothetical protein